MTIEPISAAFFVVSWATTYLLHSTLLVALAWALDRWGNIHSHSLRQGIWKSAGVIALATSVLQVGFGVSAGNGELLFSVAMRNRIDRPFDDVPPAAATDSKPDATDLLNTNREKALTENAGRPEERYRAQTISPNTNRTETLAESTEDESEERGNRLTSQQATFIAVSKSRSNSRRASEPKVTDDRGKTTIVGCGLPTIAILWSAAVICGFPLCGILYMLRQSICLYRRLHGSTCLSNGPAKRLLDQLIRRNRIRRGVKLISCDKFSEPVALGVWRRTIVLPPLTEEVLAKDELKALLAHELAHIVRGDVTWLLFGRVLCSVLSFQPLNLLVRRRWQQEAEYLCDDWAIDRGVSALSLARCLTHVAHWRLHALESSPTLSAGGPRSTVVQRVERLVSSGRDKDAWHQGPRRFVPPCLALLVALFFLLIVPRIAFTMPTVTARSLSGERDQETTDTSPVRDSASQATGMNDQFELEMQQLRMELGQVEQLLERGEWDHAAVSLFERIQQRAKFLRESARKPNDN